MQKHTIAVVDDDPGVRKSLARLLSAFGYLVEPFASAEDFLSAAPTSKAECLVVDFNLGDVSGLELARRLAAAGFEFPIIFMTGSADDTVRMQCMEFGCVAFLHKPFPEERLTEAITKAIGLNLQLAAYVGGVCIVMSCPIRVRICRSRWFTALSASGP